MARGDGETGAAPGAVAGPHAEADPTALHEALDELTALVEAGRAVPLSSSVVLPRGEVLARLDAMQDLLPEVLSQAQALLEERAAVLQQARRDAARVVEAAHEQRRQLVADSDVWQQAALDAERLTEDARTEAEQMRAQVDDYVDAKLATFEVVLHKTLAAVERGRSKLAGRTPLDELGDGPPDDRGPAAGR